MPRKTRVWYPDAIFHITSRGNHRDDIFREESDFQFYLWCIKNALDYFENKYELICYCLMTNHIHMQLKTKDLHLGEFVKRVNGLYAQNFNKKYNYTGHLFQGRYKSELVGDDCYNLEVGRYIHLNPVRANIVCKPEDYPWSSYNMYIGVESEKLINADRILSYFQSKDKRKMYQEYVESTIESCKAEKSIV